MLSILVLPSSSVRLSSLAVREGQNGCPVDELRHNVPGYDPYIIAVAQTVRLLT